MNKRGLEMSFGWIFSVIVGSVILFLAIYGATTLLRGERTVSDSSAAQEFSTILTAFENSRAASARPGNITFRSEARIYNNCTLEGPLGTQRISVAQRAGIGEEWVEAGVAARSSFLYTFSPPDLEGKTFFALTKPFSFPFKIGNVIVLWSEPYCFVNPPEEIREEIESLNLRASNLFSVGRVSECPQDAVTVCFGNSGGGACKISVDTVQQRVMKQKASVYYEGPLLYAAIFSDPPAYECTVRRLLLRGAEMASLYRAKSQLIATRSTSGCSSALQAPLIAYETRARAADTRVLSDLSTQARTLATANERSLCPLWKEDHS